MFRGRVVGEQPASHASREAIGRPLAGKPPEGRGMSSLAAATDPTASRRVGSDFNNPASRGRHRVCACNSPSVSSSTGASVPDTISAFWTGAFGSYAIGASLNRAVPSPCVALSFHLAARPISRMSEVRARSPSVAFLPRVQRRHSASLRHGAFAIAIPLLAGSLAGAIWGGIAGWLKVWRGTNEVISTLLLSFIAVNLVYRSVSSVNLLRKPQTSASTQPESLGIPGYHETATVDR